MASSSFYVGGVFYTQIAAITADVTAAQASAVAAAASASAAAASFNSFHDIYLGAKASDPTLDNDGNALQTGAIYWNTTSGVLKAWNGSAWNVVYDRTITITMIIDGGSAVITTGIKGDLHIPFAGVITAVEMLADTSGSIVLDIWKNTYANFPPVIANSVTASAPPTITTATKAQDTTLTGWTTSIAAGDILRFNVNSITSIKRVTVSLTVLKALT